MDVYNGISVHLWEHRSSSLEGSHQEVNNRMVVSLAELRRAVALLEANGVEEGTRFTLVIEQL